MRQPLVRAPEFVSSVFRRRPNLQFPFILLIALVSPRTISQAQSADSAQQASLDSARKLMDSGQLEASLKELDSVAALKPSTPGLQYLRGMVFYQQGKMVEAADAFARAVALNPNGVESIKMEGVSLYRQGKPALAIPLLERANALAPNTQIDPDYILALCYMDTHRYDDARRAFSVQYGFAADSAPAYLLAGRLSLRRDYLPIAEDSARKAIGLDANLPLAHLLLGEVMLAAGRYDEAVAAFGQEIDLNPLAGAAYERLGDAYIHRGDFSQASVALNKALLLEPSTTGPYILQGKVLLKQKNPEMARVYLERATKMDPMNYMAHSLLGQAYRALGRADDAARETEKAVQLQATDVPNSDHEKYR